MEDVETLPGSGSHSGNHGWLPMAALLFALIAEGFDLQAANFAAPGIVKAFGINKAEAGPLLSASLLGVLFGAALIGPLGDRFGRKRLIIGGCAIYGVLSLLAALATHLTQLIVLRFLIGLGLGGVLPNALALASELSRPGREATAAGLIGIGITFGAMVAGLVAAALMPTHGWQSVFVVGGLMPIAIVVALQFLLPESPAFLTRNPASERRPRSTGPAPLFRDGRGGRTAAIWLIFTAVLMCVYLLSGWIPLLLNQSGFSSRGASLVGTAYQGGGVIGGIVASLMLHRSGWNVVAMFAGSACLTMVLLVWGASATLVLVAGVVAAGFFVTGTQNAINGAGGASYEAGIRSSGLGWALGVGRIGSVVGPLVGSLAVLLGMREARYLFALPIVPLAVAALAALWLERRASLDSTSSTPD
ncbi:MAG TPA: MFS transporter [Steroidobacteraceae bacterium]|nr:MFS transporter [Steroidobacteraceae bacterium]